MKELKAAAVASGDFKPTPTVTIKKKEDVPFVGTFFEGKLVLYKTLENGYKDDKGNPQFHHIYEFEIKDTDMEITAKVDGAYKEADVNTGDIVAVFAPTRLHRILQTVQPGVMVRIEYKGKVKAKRGAKAHDYKVFAL